MKAHFSSFRTRLFWTILALSVCVGAQRAATASNSLRRGHQDPHRQLSLFGNHNDDAETERFDLVLPIDDENNFVSFAFVFRRPVELAFVPRI